MVELGNFLWHFVISALFIFLITSSITYFQTKDRAFKFYALYNLFLLLYLNAYSPYEATQYKEFVSLRYLSFVYWAIPVIYNSMMVFFYIKLLDLDKRFVKPFIRYKKITVVLVIVTILFYFVTVAINQPYLLMNYYFFIFCPIYISLGIYHMQYVYAVNTLISRLVLFAVFMYIVFASIAVYKSIIFDKSIDPITYLIIGIFLESFVFMSTLALKIKYLYDEKIQAQKEIINEKTKIFQLKEEYQNELEKKLVSQEKILRTTLEQSEEEKISRLKSQYENEILNLKLDALRSQMNPHFIFNALNSIKVYFIENNKEKAVYYLNKFSKLIRNILEFSKREYITVKEELEVIELYLTIENIRFNNAISLIFEPFDDPEITEKRIPGLILQPFVENSIWHGLMLKEGHKEIKIGCEKNNDKIGLYIQDNGIGREKAKENKMNSFKKDSLGIEFSHERLKNFNLQNQLRYTFEIIDLKDKNEDSLGTKVIFWLK